MKRHVGPRSWRANFTAPIAPWLTRRAVLLKVIAGGVHYGWRNSWLWGSKQWDADVARAVKDGLLELPPKEGPRLSAGPVVRDYGGSLPPRAHHACNRRGKRLKRLRLTAAGRALLAPVNTATAPQPYARRKAALAEFTEANPHV
ncbi:MAG TPA: hypothetical protein VGD46_19535 [Rhizobacter sp.]